MNKGKKQKTPAEREAIYERIKQRIAGGASAEKACKAEGISVGTLYNWKNSGTGATTARATRTASPAPVSNEGQVFVAVGSANDVSKAMASFFQNR